MLCPKHHDLGTHKNYETIDNGDRTWDLLPRPMPRPARRQPDARAVVLDLRIKVLALGGSLTRRQTDRRRLEGGPEWKRTT
jgi:hypothetical protein